MLNRKNLTLIVLILVALISVRFLPGCGEGLNLLTENGISDSDGTLPPVDPWGEYSYRRSVTITNSGSAQSDYQVNINLNSGNFSFANADASGNDIRFNYNGTSIPYWIENWNSGGQTASIWVKVPDVANGDTTIYIYYGNAGLSAASDFDNTFTKDSGFSGLAARWHMDEGTGTSLDDSSANSNMGTASASSLWESDDGGRWYDRGDVYFSAGDSLDLGGADYVAVPDNDSLDVTSLTISLWFYVDSTPALTRQYLVSKWLASGNMRSYALYLFGDLIYFETSFNGSASHITFSNASISTGTWYNLIATFDDASLTKKIYINGQSDKSELITDHFLRIGTAGLTIGVDNSTTLADYFSGYIDEVSIYNRAISADEAKALSQRSKYSSTVSAPVVGAEELVP